MSSGASSEITKKIRASLQQAHGLYAKQAFPEAELLYLQVLASDPVNADALQSLVGIYLQAPQRFKPAQQMLERLVIAYPGEPGFCQNYANVMMQLGKPDAAVDCIANLLKHRPELTDTRYNFARLLKAAGRPVEALAQYKLALDAGISHPEEVYSNMSNLLSDLNRSDEARGVLQRALEICPDYEPALYNLALLEEECGNWPLARRYLFDIISANPDHCDAMVRLAEGERIKASDPLVEKMKRLMTADSCDDLDREKLNFALAKVHDEWAEYKRAFKYYQQGNFCGRYRLGGYDAAGHERLIEKLITAFPGGADLKGLSCDAEPVFICGMFRSGSTLIEQMLAAHPELTAGGEIRYFNQHAPLSELLTNMGSSDLHGIGLSYLDYLAKHFPGAGRVTNKLPDNFLYLGLILSLFPKAKIIHNTRQALDNCLSIFFQPLAEQYNYACDLETIGHYYLQYKKLMAHWHRIFPDNIIDVSYDELVINPRSQLEPVLTFLGLDWDERCLRFHALENRVRTASVWQVRQALHENSSGRWKNYAVELGPLRRYLSGKVS